MPIAFIFALAASLGIHVAALFGTDIELFGGVDEPQPLRVVLQSPPPPPPATPGAVETKPPAKARPKTTKPNRQATNKPARIAVVESPAAMLEKNPEPIPELSSIIEDESPETSTVHEPAKPLLPSKGAIRFAIFYGTQRFQIGSAEHNWEFTEDGRYRLTGVTRTSGIAALLKPLVFENESSGRLVAGGLQPEQYRTRKNGKDANENADFNWTSAEVRLSRSGATQPVSPGAQDILSLNYQLAYLKNPQQGASVGVVTGKKYDRFDLDALGEENIEIPCGIFRTLHLRAMGDTVTEIWIALDHDRLPVKIRYTDKKGDIFEQVAIDIGPR